MFKRIELWSFNFGVLSLCFFFCFDSPFFCANFQGENWRLSLWLAPPRDGVPNHFFLFLGGDASCSHAATSHFCWCFEFQEQDRFLSPKKSAESWPIRTKVSMARKQTPQSKKGSTNKTQVQPALPDNSTSAIRGMKPFFFFGPPAPVGLGKFENGHRTEPVNRTRWGPKDLHFCSQVRLLKCLKLKEERQIKHGP